MKRSSTLTSGNYLYYFLKNRIGTIRIDDSELFNKITETQDNWATISSNSIGYFVIEGTSVEDVRIKPITD